MADFDVFNGDADGILSLVQLRRADPRPDAKLVTGRKRDIKLLDRVAPASSDRVTVLDVSMRSNMDDLTRILEVGADVFYVDHHNAGDIPDHPKLHSIINTSPEMCTAILVDDYLSGSYRAWSVTAAFGDNFPNLAKRYAEGHDLPLKQLQRLGILINYNGYGASVDDLFFHPAELYRALADFDTPMEFMAKRADIFEQLDEGYKSDLKGAQNAKVVSESEAGLILELPNTAASRRISGVYGNQLTEENPGRAHAVLIKQGGGYLISIRAPLENRINADTLALQFETGGGRAAAAGVNSLPENQLQDFIEKFSEIYS